MEVEAIAEAKKHHPHLIILDVMMPNSSLDGFEVCEILKREEETKHAHILMLTAMDKESDLEKGRKVGADGYFTKPFSPLELMTKVEEILG